MENWCTLRSGSFRILQSEPVTRADKASGESGRGRGLGRVKVSRGSVSIGAAVAGAMAVTFAGPVARAEGQPIEQVTVTSARLPEAVGSAAFSTVKLDKAQLAKSDRLDDALEQVPGLSLFRRTVSTSSNVTTQGVSLRNIAPSGAGRALVLLDGAPLNDPFGGWIVWTAIPFEDIGGAEVVRGAGAGPDGAGALTGTILLSERDTGDGMVDAQGGSLSSARIGASHGESIGDPDWFGSASFERSSGWIPARPPTRGRRQSRMVRRRLGEPARQHLSRRRADVGAGQLLRRRPRRGAGGRADPSPTEQPAA